MKKQISYMCLAFVAAVMGSCTEDSVLQQSEGDAGTINFIMSTGDVANTRTKTETEEISGDLSTSFVAGDEVGVFAVCGESDICLNNKYTAAAAGSAVTWSTGAPISNEPRPTAFYAYYPYTVGNTDKTAISHTILTDQDNEASYNKSDLLTSVVNNPAFTDDGGNKKVSLPFTHQLALVQVKVRLGSSTEAPSNMKLLNVKTKVKVNLTGDSSPTVTTDEGTSDAVFMYKYGSKLDAADNYVHYRAVVPAQTIANTTPILEFTLAGKIYQLKHANGVTYNSGKIRNIAVTIEQTGGDTPQIGINIGDTDIVGWGTDDSGGDITGSAEYTGEAPTEIGGVAIITSAEDVIKADPTDGWPAADFKGWYLKGAKANLTLTCNKVEGSNGVEFYYSNSGGSTSPHGLYYFFGPCIKGANKYKLSFKMQPKVRASDYGKFICTIFNFKPINDTENKIDLSKSITSFATASENQPLSTDGEKITVDFGFESASTNFFASGYKFLWRESLHNSAIEYSFVFDVTNYKTLADTKNTQPWNRNDYDNLVIGFAECKVSEASKLTISDVKLEPVTE